MSCNSHQYLELYHAGFLGAGRHQPAQPAPRRQGAAVHPAPTRARRSCFVDAFFAEHFARNIAEVRDELPLRHVVLIGDGDVPHDVGYEDLIAAGEPGRARRARRGRSRRADVHGRHDRPAQGRAARPARRDAEPVPHRPWPSSFGDDRVYLHQTPMFHAASMGGDPRHPGDGRHVGVRPAVRARPRSWTSIEQHRGRLDRDGADDDRAWC